MGQIIDLCRRRAAIWASFADDLAFSEEDRKAFRALQRSWDELVTRATSRNPQAIASAPREAQAVSWSDILADARRSAASN